MSREDEGGAQLQVRETQVQIARATLALGRHDLLALRCHLELAQRAAYLASTALEGWRGND